MQVHTRLPTILYFLVIATLACNDNQTTSNQEKKKFPESTDSLAAGLHPHYPTEENIAGSWILPHPIDTSAHRNESYIELKPDKSIVVSEYPYLSPEKWELKGDSLIFYYSQTNVTKHGAPAIDTMVIEAVSDTTLHFFHLHEPNFLMYLVKKK
jgi:hypothetical protein